MKSIEQSVNNNIMEHASNGPPKYRDINDIVGAPQLDPRVGDEYQVEVPSMITELERLQLQRNPADSEVVQDHSLSFAFGLPIPVTWMHNEVEDSEDEGKGDDEYTDGTADAIEPEKAAKKNVALAPGRLSKSWSDTDVKRFLVGLFIFGKNFVQIERFLENKEMGEILSFYYGKFYKSDEYRRWSGCRKMKGRKRLTGQKLFTGWRQQELLSRLIPHVSEESRDTLLEVSKSYVEGNASLEEYVSYLKSTVGLGVLVEAIGIGKEKEDLTRLSLEPKKKNKVFPTPTCKAWSSLGPSDIMKILTGGSRLSKTKSNDLFWEAVWPRLLARGWHSEQPKNQGYVASKGYLVFLIPGVKKFSRRKLVKGDHYFDSVSDVLSKVGAEPNLLELEEEANVDSCNDEEPEKGSNEDVQSDYHRPCYLKPRASTCDKDHIKFMVIDTSLAPGGKSSDIRALKSVPINSVGKVDVDSDGESIDQKLTTFTVIDTSMLYEGKLLKKVRELRNLPVESDIASKLTGLSRKTKGSSPNDDSSSVLQASMSNTDSRRGVSYSDATNRKEVYDNPDNGANKVVQSQQKQKDSVSEDNLLKRTIKHQFRRRARSGHSNHAALPTKRRRLTACAKAEASQAIENSSGRLASTKLSSSFLDAKTDDPVSHQQNGNLVASSADKSVTDNHEEIILNDNPKCKSISFVKKCESPSPVTFNIPQEPSKPKNSDMPMVEEDGQCLKENDPLQTSATEKVADEPLRTSCDIGSVEQQPNANPRRQSTRNRPLTVRALESIANEFFHVQRRQKRKGTQTLKDPFSPCRRARSIRRNCSDHGTAVSVEEKHLNGDSNNVSKMLASSLQIKE